MRLERVTSEGTSRSGGPAVLTVLFLSAAFALVWLRLRLPTPGCLFHAWTGIPCPTCGSTRLVEALLDGDPLAAFSLNPLVFTALAGVSIWAAVSTIRRLIGLPPLRLVLGEAERRAARALLIILVIAGWVWQIVSGA